MSTFWVPESASAYKTRDAAYRESRLRSPVVYHSHGENDACPGIVTANEGIPEDLMQCWRR